MRHTLTPRPLTREAFAPFGDVIETEDRDHFLINNGSTQRFHRLADIDTGPGAGQAIISIFRAQALPLPLRIRMLERHPLGSQAFVPLKGNPFLIVVAPPGEAPAPFDVQVFITNGEQGINYHRGVWHHPVLAVSAVDDFLIVDRAGEGHNCDEYFFNEDIELWLECDR
ncbi:ureidoglycolate lyase [Pseudomonas duriflava]|uniref:Ureidoglycolate lyase n=1 Tax=Pseudomonas duriflava TaxID=459528 RepID=A0A562Q813_9PSED|nr:ureidoglycolate lyase [Pseudomonas duriflava]TWI52834.1 ureidoglycolate lyase [Pseudomonas duriflava]